MENIVCNEENCPVHGSLKTRGMLQTGIVKSAKAKKSAIVVINYFSKVEKYGRLKKKKSNIHVHVPSCMTVKEGETVKIAECRKISKTKAHVLVPDKMVL